MLAVEQLSGDEVGRGGGPGDVDDAGRQQLALCGAHSCSIGVTPFIGTVYGFIPHHIPPLVLRLGNCDTRTSAQRRLRSTPARGGGDICDSENREGCGFICPHCEEQHSVARLFMS